MHFLKLGLAGLLAVSFLTVACGDDDDDDTTDSTPTTAADATPDSGDGSLGYSLTAPAEATTTETGLQYIDLIEGDGASPTGPTASVLVHYRGLLPDGTQFDSSYDRGEPAQFALNGVIPGFAEGILTMKVGGHRVLYIPGDIAYGPGGNPRAGIGPDQPLVFEVELLAAN